MDNIYREEYTRETARIAARKDAEPKPKTNKKSPVRFVAPAMLGVFLVYTLYNLAGVVGLNYTVFLDIDFVIVALALTAMFIWARKS